MVKLRSNDGCAAAACAAAAMGPNSGQTRVESRSNARARRQPTNNNRGNGIRVFKSFAAIEAHLQARHVPSYPSFYPSQPYIRVFIRAFPSGPISRRTTSPIRVVIRDFIRVVIRDSDGSPRAAFRRS